MCCCSDCSQLGERDISRWDTFTALIVSLVCLGCVAVTGWRIYLEHNYLVDDTYFFIGMFPSALLLIITVVLFLTMCFPEAISACSRGCCQMENAYFAFFKWCDPILFMFLQILIWVPFVCLSRVHVSHGGANSTDSTWFAYIQRLRKYDYQDWPLANELSDYTLDLLFVQSCILILVIARTIFPGGGLTFRHILQFTIFWLAEAVDLVAFLDELNKQVLEHDTLPWAVAITSSVITLQFVPMCTFLFYPAVFHSEDEKRCEQKGERLRVTMTLILALVDDIPLFIIRILILKDIYLPLREISALYFLFLVKSFLFGITGITLAIVETVKFGKKKKAKKGGVKGSQVMPHQEKMEIEELDVVV